MLLLQKDEATAARRRIPLYLVDSGDGITPETAVSPGTAELKVSKNGAGEANFGGSWNNVGNGIYYYEATAAELDTVGYLSLRLAVAGVRTFIAVAQVVAFDPYDVAAMGMTNLDAAVSDAATATNVSDGVDAVADYIDAVLADTIAELPQGQPPKNPTPLQALMLLYMALRNASKATATLRQILDDAGTVIAKATMSDDTTTFDQGKLISGA